MISKCKSAVLACLTIMATGMVARGTAQQIEQHAPKRTLVRAGHVLDVKTGKILELVSKIGSASRQALTLEAV